MSRLREILREHERAIRRIEKRLRILRRVDGPRPYPASCPSCGQPLPGKVNEDVLSLLIAAWSRGRDRQWHAAELEKLARSLGLCQDAYASRTPHGRVIAFSLRVLRPAVGGEISRLVLRRWRSGSQRRYFIELIWPDDEPEQDVADADEA